MAAGMAKGFMAMIVGGPTGIPVASFRNARRRKFVSRKVFGEHPVASGGPDRRMKRIPVAAHFPPDRTR
jgi:hypothetical protein